MNEPIYFSEEHLSFRDNLRRFVDSEVVPQAEAWETSGMVPRAVLAQLGELGYLGIRYPAEYGGAALDTVYSAILAEELGRSSFGGFAVTVLVHTDMASPHLANFGSPEQLARYLPGVIKGQTITAVAVTEAGAGSDVAGIRTSAVRDGDSYVLNGTKMFITNGVHGDLYFVAAKTDAKAKGSRGISMFIVEKGTPGFAVGRSLDKMGWLCSDTAELVFSERNDRIEYLVGTMIEVPRAALVADKIAQSAEFFSFGTNDLTQMTFGYSRDDAGKFLPVYLKKNILKHDPFQILDQEGVGQLIKMAVERGRSTRPKLKVGICGEHGGEPSSVEFCHTVGMNYVSCSPFRVPIARLAAAQAAIKEK